MVNYYLFRCSPKTYDECLDKMLFGQTESMKERVKNVKSGDCLFLHNVLDSKNLEKSFIEGPYFAISDGSKDIIPKAWLGKFPWQVKVEKRTDITRIRPDTFSKLYMSYAHVNIYFNFEIPKNIGDRIISEMGLILDKKKSDKSVIHTDKNHILNSELDFRLKFEAKYRCEDGHYVRSKSETMIDNWFYNHEILHVYEKKITGLNMVCDFYIKKCNVYIEYWGLDDKIYLQRRKTKENLYKTNKLKLINLEEKDIQLLDDVLPEKLKSFGLII